MALAPSTHRIAACFEAGSSPPRADSIVSAVSSRNSARVLPIIHSDSAEPAAIDAVQLALEDFARAEFRRANFVRKKYTNRQRICGAYFATAVEDEDPLAIMLPTPKRARKGGG